jgi:hypothetical protein
MKTNMRNSHSDRHSIFLAFLNGLGFGIRYSDFVNLCRETIMTLMRASFAFVSCSEPHLF